MRPLSHVLFNVSPFDPRSLCKIGFCKVAARGMTDVEHIHTFLLFQNAEDYAINVRARVVRLTR
jgi:hypothetical protein